MSPVRLSRQPCCSEETADVMPDGDGCIAECCPAECYPCGTCRPCCFIWHNRLWVRGEYLLWWTQGSALPPLVTTSPEGTDPSVSGVLGQPGTSILFGNGMVNTEANSGWRGSMGYWFDDCQCVGVEAGYLGLGKETTRFSASSQERPILARPFYDAQFSVQSAMLAAHPDFLGGSLDCEATSQLQAVEVLLRRNLFQRECDRMDFLFGWRFAQLDESVRIDQFSEWTRSQGPIVVGTTKSLYDLFDTQNQFNGVELGVMYREYVGRWSWEALLKLGLGSTRSRVLIDGMTTTTVPGGGTATFTGDLLAQETNIGEYTQNQFAVLPEIGVALGYALTPRFHARIGYAFLYWSRVARPADQLDTNASQLPPETPTGSLQPAFSFTMSDYWAQGVSFGLEYRF
ncbi:MAG: BBP7 family outer membrane beta-barrel protein [Pirellulales bacterium]|nr:BBP7 family outer membrane beta-barrel protein [Pirellulales bacterium]